MRIHHDPWAAERATAADLKAARVIAESAPVRCADGALLDGDAESLRRMEEIVAALADDHSLEWRLADNSEVVITVGQLRGYLDEVRRARALRLPVVFREYRALRESPDTTLRDVDNWLRQYGRQLEHEPKR